MGTKEPQASVVADGSEGDRTLSTKADDDSTKVGLTVPSLQGPTDLEDTHEADTNDTREEDNGSDAGSSPKQLVEAEERCESIPPPPPPEDEEQHCAQTGNPPVQTVPPSAQTTAAGAPLVEVNGSFFVPVPATSDHVQRRGLQPSGIEVNGMMVYSREVVYGNGREAAYNETTWPAHAHPQQSGGSCSAGSGGVGGPASATGMMDHSSSRSNMLYSYGSHPSNPRSEHDQLNSTLSSGISLRSAGSEMSLRDKIASAQGAGYVKNTLMADPNVQKNGLMLDAETYDKIFGSLVIDRGANSSAVVDDGAHHDRVQEHGADVAEAAATLLDVAGAAADGGVGSCGAPEGDVHVHVAAESETATVPAAAAEDSSAAGGAGGTGAGGTGAVAGGDATAAGDEVAAAASAKKDPQGGKSASRKNSATISTSTAAGRGTASGLGKDHSAAAQNGKKGQDLRKRSNRSGAAKPAGNAPKQHSKPERSEAAQQGISSTSPVHPLPPDATLAPAASPAHQQAATKLGAVGDGSQQEQNNADADLSAMNRSSTGAAIAGTTDASGCWYPPAASSQMFWADATALGLPGGGAAAVFVGDAGSGLCAGNSFAPLMGSAASGGGGSMTTMCMFQPGGNMMGVGNSFEPAGSSAALRGSSGGPWNQCQGYQTWNPGRSAGSWNNRGGYGGGGKGAATPKGHSHWLQQRMGAGNKSASSATTPAAAANSANTNTKNTNTKNSTSTGTPSTNATTSSSGASAKGASASTTPSATRTPSYTSGGSAAATAGATSGKQHGGGATTNGSYRGSGTSGGASRGAGGHNGGESYNSNFYSSGGCGQFIGAGPGSDCYYTFNSSSAAGGGFQILSGGPQTSGKRNWNSSRYNYNYYGGGYNQQQQYPASAGGVNGTSGAQGGGRDQVGKGGAEQQKGATPGKAASAAAAAGSGGDGNASTTQKLAGAGAAGVAGTSGNVGSGNAINATTPRTTGETPANLKRTISLCDALDMTPRTSAAAAGASMKPARPTNKTPTQKPETQPRHEVQNVLSNEDCDGLQALWEKHRRNFGESGGGKHGKSPSKPQMLKSEYGLFFDLCQKVVQAMADSYQTALVLDHATISATNEQGHKRHADCLEYGVFFPKKDWEAGATTTTTTTTSTTAIPRDGLAVVANSQFQRKGLVSVQPDPAREAKIGGWEAQKPQLAAARNEKAVVMWKGNSTEHRNYSCFVNLVAPAGWTGGEVRFFDALHAETPAATYKADRGCGVTFCGNAVHDVTPVTQGFRLCLLVWTRASSVSCPAKAQKTPYFRPGTGDAVWLLLADLSPTQKSQVCHPQRSEKGINKNPEKARKPVLQIRAEEGDMTGPAAGPTIGDEEIIVDSVEMPSQQDTPPAPQPSTTPLQEKQKKAQQKEKHPPQKRLQQKQEQEQTKEQGAAQQMSKQQMKQQSSQQKQQEKPKRQKGDAQDGSEPEETRKRTKSKAEQKEQQVASQPGAAPSRSTVNAATPTPPSPGASATTKPSRDEAAAAVATSCETANADTKSCCTPVLNPRSKSKDQEIEAQLLEQAGTHDVQSQSQTQTPVISTGKTTAEPEQQSEQQSIEENKGEQVKSCAATPSDQSSGFLSQAAVEAQDLCKNVVRSLVSKWSSPKSVSTSEQGDAAVGAEKGSQADATTGDSVVGEKE